MNWSKTVGTNTKPKLDLKIFGLNVKVCNMSYLVKSSYKKCI